MVLVQQKESSRLQDALGPSFTSAVVGISVNGDVVEVFGTVSPGPWKVLISKGKHTCKGKKTQIQTILNFLLDIQSLQTRPIIMGIRPAKSNKSLSSYLLARGPRQA